jgi:hypothetical protein
MTQPTIFKDMTREEKLMLCEAAIDGEKIELCTISGEWVGSGQGRGEVVFVETVAYRVATPALVATEWPWEHITDWVNFIAHDGDGSRWVGYLKEPRFSTNGWRCNGFSAPIGEVKPIVEGNMPWAQSLCARPQIASPRPF